MDEKKRIAKILGDNYYSRFGIRYDKKGVTKMELVLTQKALSFIVNQYCSCGGRGIDDDPCDACKVYHAIMAVAEKATKSKKATTEQARDLAKKAYDGYAAYTGYKSVVTGDQLPKWDDLPIGVKNAWLAAANNILRRCQE